MAENPRESNGYVAKVYEGERIIPARELTPDNGYTVGVDVAKPGSDRTAITLKLNVDVSDALTGLKALRREADAAVRSLKALEKMAGHAFTDEERRRLAGMTLDDVWGEREYFPLRPEVSE
jgi:hypothetical protein